MAINEPSAKSNDTANDKSNVGHPLAYTKELLELHGKVEEQYDAYIKNEFDLRLAHHNSIKELLEKRDTILLEKMTEADRSRILADAFENYDLLLETLPVNPNKTYDSSLINFIIAELLPGYKVKVKLMLKPNEYIKNQELVRVISLFNPESEPVKIEWIDERGRCPLFDFFESEEEDFEIFDMIYDFYVNLQFYSVNE